MNNTDSYFLICRLKKDDVASFEEVYKRYYSKLYGVAKKFGTNTLEAEDFVQQTFIKLWEGRQQLQDDVLLDKQLYVICKHLILNYIKREKKMVSNQDFISSHITMVEPEENHPNEDWTRLNASIQKMPPKRREIYVMHKIENLTYKEIGTYLNISKKTIANQIYLATDFLKKEFKKF